MSLTYWSPPSNDSVGPNACKLTLMYESESARHCRNASCKGLPWSFVGARAAGSAGQEAKDSTPKIELMLPALEPAPLALRERYRTFSDSEYLLRNTVGSDKVNKIGQIFTASPDSIYQCEQPDCATRWSGLTRATALSSF